MTRQPPSRLRDRMLGLKYAAAILAVASQLGSFRVTAQTNAATPSVQIAVSNLLSRFTNEEARAAFKARLATQFLKPEPAPLPLNVVTGWSTNGPAVYTQIRFASTNYNNNPVFAELNRLGYPTPPLSALWYYTNLVFDHFLPASLNNLCWTNFIAHTNGRTTQIWSVRTHPAGWPVQPPVVRWNTNCLMWGMRGLTAISPCWEAESGPGQPPITALTKRHGYTRGHAIASDGFGKLFPGKKIWFLTRDNKLVETTVIGTVVRTHPPSAGDYTMLLFSHDLPETIEPLRVTSATTMASKIPVCLNSPGLIYMTEQLGNVSAGAPGFTVPIKKAGDSGSPNMIPLPGELVFYGGRTTTGPTPEMQADMDELCRRSGLDPAKYQMQWVDLSGFPSF